VTKTYYSNYSMAIDKYLLISSAITCNAYILPHQIMSATYERVEARDITDYRQYRPTRIHYMHRPSRHITLTRGSNIKQYIYSANDTTITVFNCALRVAEPRICNGLPVDVQSSHWITVFKSRLKALFFNSPSNCANWRGLTEQAPLHTFKYCYYYYYYN